MPLANFIGIHHVQHQGPTYTVVLTRNASGSVSGQCMLAPTEQPIFDGPTVATVLRTIEDTLEALLFVRAQHKHA
jgi:hypothetical protein